jgi:hypothetical protein|nr:MAG TPA: type-2 restriction enzyme [Caudoviricetes sp.]
MKGITNTCDSFTIEISGLIRKDELLQALRDNGIEHEAEINDIIENLPQYGMKLTNATIKTSVEQLAKNMGCKVE